MDCVNVSKIFRNDAEHTIPLGSIVEFEVEDWCEDIHRAEKEIVIGIKKGTLILYVVGHSRDCDGTPLYCLASSPYEMPLNEKIFSPKWNLFHALSKIVYANTTAEGLKIIGYRKLFTVSQFIQDVQSL